MTLTGLPSIIQPTTAATGHVPHAPIVIDGNSGFVPSNGVSSGSGSSTDPFVIREWEIDGQPTAIQIQNTNDYLVIQNVYLLSNSNAVILQNVTHASLQYSTLTQNTYGVRIDGSTSITIRNNNVTGAFYGIDVNAMNPEETSKVSIENNTISNGTVGISTAPTPFVHDVSITSNTIWSNSQTGISVNSAKVIVSKNNITKNGIGIDMSSTSDANGNLLSSPVVTENLVALNGRGIVSYGAVGITLDGNTLVHNGFEIPDPGPYQNSSPIYYDSHTIPLTNMIDGKPLLYMAKCHDVLVDGRLVSEIIIASCDNLELANMQFQNANSTAVEVAFSRNITINGLGFTSNSRGLAIIDCNEANVHNNDFVSDEGPSTLSVSYSGNVTIERNSFEADLLPVTASKTTELRIANNSILSSSGPSYGLGYGQHGTIVVADSSSVLITGNLVGNNPNDGIQLSNPTNATVSANTIAKNGGTGITVAVANGLNITDNNLVQNGAGLDLLIMDAQGNLRGIFNTIVYHNNFVSNTAYQASYDSGQPSNTPVNISWDNGYPSGGNYWSNYTGVDNCSGPNQNTCTGPDGIGDTPFQGLVAWYFHNEMLRSRTQAALVDHYPLMKPYGNYTFDKIPPSWAAGATLTYSAVNSTTINLQWQAATDDSWIQSYMVYQNGTLLGEVPGYVHNYTVTRLIPGTTYNFEVLAKDPANNQSTSSLSRVITIPEPSGPSNAPALLTSILNETYPYIIISGAAIGATAILLRYRRTRKTKQYASSPSTI